MRTTVCFLILLISTITIAQKNKWIENYSTIWQKFDVGTRLLATNNNYQPITFVIDFKTENLKSDTPNGTYIVVPAGAIDFKVAEFEMLDKKKGWKFKKNSTLTYLGDLTDQDYDVDYIYSLPFEKGASFKIGQGYDGKISHQNKFAIDFTMPVNTPIHASRDGLVVEVVKSNFKSCDKPSCIKFNNYIKILHDDGTIMQYLHMKRNGVKVKPGDQVSKGQLIAYSGNVGYSTGPHLHIDLYLTNKNNKYQTLKTKFRTQNDSVVSELKQGEIYLKDY